MDANTYQLQQVLSPDRRFVIPTFQRDYAWTKDEQWELLFTDLEEAAGRLGRARRDAEHGGISPQHAEKGLAPHFLGALVLDQLPTPTGKLQQRAVIDGQQRLTTLQLLLRGLLDVLIEIGSERVPQVRRLLENPDYVTKGEPDAVHKLWPRRRDREAWRTAMHDEVPVDEHAYSKARRYFAERTHTALNDGEPGEQADLLVDAVLDLFKVVVIDLEDNDDAQVIFEVLNGRQTPLTPAELVKNLLFLRAELQSEQDVESLYDTYWAPLDDPWWSVKVGTGHAARRRTDAMLGAWLTAATGKEANVGHLYGAARRWIEASNRRVPDLLADLNEYAAAYRAVTSGSPVDLPPVDAAYRRVQLLNITTAVPLLAWLRTLSKDVLSGEQHLSAVRAIDSWIIRRLFLGHNTRGYATAFVEVLNAAKAARMSGDDVAAAVVAALANKPGNKIWPDDAHVLEQLPLTKLYVLHSSMRIKMLLGALDEYLQEQSTKTESVAFDYGALWIEHLMPQRWGAHWPLGVVGGDERDQYVHRLGNLTLVTASLDIALSNAPWYDKRGALAEHAALRLTAQAVQRETWDEEAIQERGRRLAEVFCEVWPGPDSLLTVTEVA